MPSLYSTATEYVANALTFSRGSIADVTSVGVFHTTDPTHIPTDAEFTTARIVQAPDPLAQGTNIDVITLIGPGTGADLALAKGDWQRWVMVKTANEVIIRKVDVVVVS